MPNLHIACDFVFDVTRSLLIMQWTRCEYARTTRTRRSFSVASLEQPSCIFFPLFSPSILYSYLFISLFIYFPAIFFVFSWRKRKLSFVDKIQAGFFFIFDPFPIFFLFFI